MQVDFGTWPESWSVLTSVLSSERDTSFVCPHTQLLCITKTAHLRAAGDHVPTHAHLTAET